MAVKNNKRTLVTKRIFHEALLELMKDKTISKITIKEICEKAEMSRSTFYLHYQDPFMLLDDLESQVLIKTDALLNNFNDSFGTLESIESFLNFFRSNEETFGILLNGENFQKKILSGIEHHIKINIPEMLDDKYAEYQFAFVMNGSINLIKKWMDNRFDLSTHELAQVIYSLCHNKIKITK